MAGTFGRRRRTGFVWLAAALLATLAMPSAALATPSAPSLVNATVKNGVNVELTWTGSTDAEYPNDLVYEVYRDDVPMKTVADCTVDKYVDDITASPATVLAAMDEAGKKFTYYYAIVVTNTNGDKNISINVAPNVHGSLRSGMPTLNCQLCHNVHGAGDEDYLGAATRYKCYRCHGNTDPATDYGDKAVRNAQKDFYDYTEGQTIPPNVSRHYNQYMVDNETECTACHTPHKSPYYVNPVTALKEDANSYTQLLRAEIAAKTYFYNKDNAIAGNAFCFQCHGSNTTALDFNAGAGAYDRTAGDHNQAGYTADAAHGNTMIYTNDDSHATNPAIQCEACHNKHASAADKLIAYRGNDTSSTSTDGTYAQAELCFACHSTSYTSELRTASTQPYFAWNGQDVKAAFTTSKSHHPYVVTEGDPAPQPGALPHTTAADFSAYTHTNTSVDSVIGDADGAIRLSKITAVNDSFEWTASDWTTQGWNRSTTNYITKDTDAADVHSGSQSVLFTGNGSNTYYLSRATNSAIGGYIITFWWKTSAWANTGDSLRLQTFNGATWTTQITMRSASGPATAWAPVTYTLPAGTTNFRFYFDTSNNTELAWVDDVVVEATGYQTVGTARSSSAAPDGLVSWTSISGVDNKPAGTGIAYDVLDGSTNTALMTNQSLPIDISGLTATSLKVDAKMTGNGTTYPYLESLNFSYIYQPEKMGNATCVNCHNVHSVGTGGTTAWSTARVSDPSNTKNPAPGTMTAFCITCHDASSDADSPVPIGKATSASTLVPYTVEFRPIDSAIAPFFPGWNKSVPGAEFTSSGHRASTIGQFTSGAPGQMGCETCHEPHASDNEHLIALTVSASTGPTGHLNATRNDSTALAEEGLCYSCHNQITNPRGGTCTGSTGCHGTDMRFLSVGSAMTKATGHPVTSVSGVHEDTEDASNLGDGSRHAECVDCHDPHALRGGATRTHATYSSKAGDALRGIWGVNPNYPVHTSDPLHTGNFAEIPSSAFTRTKIDGEATDYEAYLCFKCHSDYVTLPASVTTNSGTYPPTDIAQEFNPSNFSEHNVLGQSLGMESAFRVGTTTYTWALPVASRTFKVGTSWGFNSMMTCTDCHTGYDASDPTLQAKGPHGSAVDYLIDPDYPRPYAETKLGDESAAAPGFHADSICAKCHSLTDGSTWGNYVHEKHARGYDDTGRQGDGCTTCHVSVPHGWKRPRLIGYRTDPEPYKTNSYGFTSMTMRNYSNVGAESAWQESYCGGSGSGCDKHGSGASTPVWP